MVSTSHHTPRGLFLLLLLLLLHAPRLHPPTLLATLPHPSPPHNPSTTVPSSYKRHHLRLLDTTQSATRGPPPLPLPPPLSRPRPHSNTPTHTNTNAPAPTLHLPRRQHTLLPLQSRSRSRTSPRRTSPCPRGKGMACKSSRKRTRRSARHTPHRWFLRVPCPTKCIRESRTTTRQHPPCSPAHTSLLRIQQPTSFPFLPRRTTHQYPRTRTRTFVRIARHPSLQLQLLPPVQLLHLPRLSSNTPPPHHPGTSIKILVREGAAREPGRGPGGGKALGRVEPEVPRGGRRVRVMLKNESGEGEVRGAAGGAEGGRRNLPWGLLPFLDASHSSRTYPPPTAIPSPSPSRQPHSTPSPFFPANSDVGTSAQDPHTRDVVMRRCSVA
ncbi:hypothetical protein M427DRAFT_205102 [Gonapodya prolifera JEL478]|uniref:Uncharacterized protein n=1 Tax=Gonapodya prolifera (strain JEL478) TaxID=1344416 RepID=A0A138ZZC6_GONPJ|nr:hypothetical protein M427DRAFT_205102 [Gonapodya prolifera JEL478]|eukprot:KXS09862.1 hypothetical protein M427DRAFT_205102 [Gonapodya prolifera JEL478]